MKSTTLSIFIVLITTISAVAQQATNQVDAESQSLGLQVVDQPDEDRIQLLLDLGSVYFSDGDLESAITAYERVLEIDPMNKQARVTMVLACIATKQYAKAEQMLNGLIEDYPEDADHKNNLAWMYATAEDPAFRKGEKAIELAQEAMVINPYDYHVWSTLAEAYYAAGEYEKAYRAINQMLALAKRYGSDITEGQAKGYVEQVRKCKRALDTEKALQGDEEEEPSSPSVDEDAQ